MKFILFVLFLCQASALQAENNSLAKKIFQESLNASRSFTSCSYEATWKVLGLGTQDTVVQVSQVQIKFQPITSLGIDSFYCTYLSKRISYNGKNLVIIDTVENNVSRVSDTQKIRQELYTMPLTLFVLYFVDAGYSPTLYLKEALDTTNKIKIDNEVIVGGESCYKIIVEYPENESIISSKDEFYISKSTKLLRRFTSETVHRNYGGAKQYFSIEINNLKIEPLQFNAQFYKDIIMEERIPKTSVSSIKTGFTPGQQLPNITIRTLDNQVIECAKNKDTLYLLYSWFIGCAGCEQSRPMMKEFYEKYASKHPFKIVGLNIVNNDEKLIQKYLIQKEIRYTNAMIDQKDKKLLQLEAPTFILVKNNTVLLYQMGYAPIVKEMLEQAILPNL